MSIRVELPGGQWAELREADELTGADQDGFLDEYDRVIQEVPQPAPEPDPANPAVMLPRPARQLDAAGNRALRDWQLGRLITGWSFDLPLPYTGQYREVLPVRVCNALQKAIKPMQDALTDTENDAGEDEDGGAPKSGLPGGTGGSEGTSPAGSPNLLPAPPAVTSGTP